MINNKKQIFFVASIYAIPDLFEDYERIVATIAKNGCAVKNNWLEEWRETYKELKEQGKKKLSDKQIGKQRTKNKFFLEHLPQIKESDMIVAEVSKPTSGMGYQLYYAISHKIPVLALYREDIVNLDEIKLLINTDSPWVTLKKYNKKNLDFYISRFFEKENKGLKKFNFLISDEIDKYLEWIQKRSPERSKSDLLRKKILEEIVYKDEEFLKKYIDN